MAMQSSTGLRSRLSVLSWLSFAAVALVLPNVAYAQGAEGGAGSYETPFAKQLIQPPTLPRPGAASVVGSLAKTAFLARDLSRGTYLLPSPFQVPEDRGPLLAKIFPPYSPGNALSEWGMGRESELAITRFRVSGELDYLTDEFTSPWGRLRQGTDGHYYPLGLTPAVRLTFGPSSPVVPKGSLTDRARSDEVGREQ